jgi:hypothetical protein
MKLQLNLQISIDLLERGDFSFHHFCDCWGAKGAVSGVWNLGCTFGGIDMSKKFWLSA